MLALSPPLFSTNIGYWPLEEALAHEHQNYIYGDNIESTNSSAQSIFLNFPQPSSNQQPRADPIDSMTTTISSDISMTVKKLNHNASERDRRKKINQLYSSLRNLLPPSDHTKKLSIPATVSQVLKYIPELQKEVEGLAQKREELLSKINSSHQENLQVKQEIINCNKRKSTHQAIPLSSFSARQLNDKEVSLQISSHDLDKNPLSEILHNLEKDGFLVLNASSFTSFGGRIFHNLHLKMDGSYSVEYGSLGGKLSSLCDTKKELFL